jgi:hypothetical protein
MEGLILMPYNELYESINDIGTRDIKSDLKRLIQECQGNIQQALEKKADEVIAYYDSIEWFGLLGLNVRRQNNRGEWIFYNHTFAYGPEDRKKLRAYMPTRLSRFLAMFKEDDLKKSLEALGASVRECTPSEDMKYKFDLVVDEKYLVSVFKDTPFCWDKALSKINCAEPIEGQRVYFAYNRYNSPKDLGAVAKWYENIEKYKIGATI